MRYHFERPNFYTCAYGKTYICDHPLYNRCTLYLIGENGLAVIQQRFDADTKHTYWAEIDPWAVDPIYICEGFLPLFERRAKPSKDGLYPTLTVRQIMWALKMKPLPKERWETVFDRKDI